MSKRKKKRAICGNQFDDPRLKPRAWFEAPGRKQWVVDQFHKYIEENGRSPRRIEFQNYLNWTLHQFDRFMKDNFGNWNEFQVQCGVKPRTSYRYTYTEKDRQEMIQQFNEYISETGHEPLQNTFKLANCGYKWKKHHIIQAFGNWNNYRVACGYKKKHVYGWMYFNQPAQDGHICHSKAEIIIDNWLFEHGIEHDKDVPYPGYNGNNRPKTCDFVVGELWIEYLGLYASSGNIDDEVIRNYHEKTELKKQMAKEQNIELVLLYPKKDMEETIQELKQILIKHNLYKEESQETGE